MFRKGMRYSVTVALILALSACGGGGDSKEPSVTPSASGSNAVPASLSIALPEQINLGAAVSLSSGIAYANTNGLTFKWSFGDGSISSDPTPVHTYAQAGDFVVELTVTDTTGASTTSRRTLHVDAHSYVQSSLCDGRPTTGWCWQAPKTTGNAINDVFFLDQANGWAVGSAGTILYTTDGGATWPKYSSVPAEKNLIAVKFTDAQHGWVLASDNNLFNTTDGGAHWSQHYANSAYNCGDHHNIVIKGNLVYIDCDYADFYTTDGGDTWNTAGNTFDVGTFETTGKQWSANNSYVIYSTDLWKTSKIVLSFPSNIYNAAVSFSDPQNGWVVANDYQNGKILTWKTIDGGENWTQVSTITAPIDNPNNSYYVNSIRAIKFPSTARGWMVVGDYSQKLLTTNDGGQTWTEARQPCGSSYWYGSSSPILFANESVLAYQCQYYSEGYYITEDQGTTWSQLRPPSASGYPLSLTYLAPRSYLVRYQTGSYKTTDNGATWTYVIQGTSNSANTYGAVWFFDQLHGVVAANDQSVLKTSDGGATWTEIAPAYAYNSNYYASPVQDLQFSSTTTGWLIRNGAPSRTTDGGASWWAPSPSAFNDYQVGLHFLDENTGWTIGGTGIVYSSSDGGAHWKKLTQVPDYTGSIRLVSASIAIVGGSNGTVWKTTDSGTTWKPYSTNLTGLINKVRFINQTVGWAISNNGGVAKTEDGGATWTAFVVPRRGTNFNDIQVSADGKHVWLVGSYGDLVTTSDGGRSWSHQGNGVSTELKSVFFLDTNTGWAVGANGSILATTTGGF